jgi:phosphoglycolate phosphatase-like HAD superfamily hydrolase
VGEGRERDPVLTRPLAAFDIDGVLADVRHRLRHVERRPKDWEAFFAAAPDDPPLAPGVALVLESAKDCEVVYVTGRPERCRADTLAWFDKHGLPAGRLSMRGGRDRRPARIAKPELLQRLAAGRVVAVVVDDDPAVCAAYEQAGFPVLRAEWMGSEPALRQAQEDEGRT